MGVFSNLLLALAGILALICLAVLTAHTIRDYRAKRWPPGRDRRP